MILTHPFTLFFTGMEVLATCFLFGMCLLVGVSLVYVLRLLMHQERRQRRLRHLRRYETRPLPAFRHKKQVTMVVDKLATRKIPRV